MKHRPSIRTVRYAAAVALPLVLAVLLCGTGCARVGVARPGSSPALPSLGSAWHAITARAVDPRWLGVNLDPDPLERDRSKARRIWYYMVSRFMDTLDLVTINAGFGPGMHLEVHATNFFRLGAGGSWLASIGTGEAPRQYGFFGRGSAEMSVGPMQLGSLDFDPFLATGEPFEDDYSGFRAPWDQMYRRQRDYWAFGISGAFIVIGGQLEFHPVQFVDWMMGWFGKDPLGDDV